MKSLTPPCRVQGEFVRLNMSWCVPWRVRESSVCVGVARVGGSGVCARERVCVRRNARVSVAPWACPARRRRVFGRSEFRSRGREREADSAVITS